MEVNVKNMNNVINVHQTHIAQELGIEVGDLLISVNEQPIQDIIEYRFLLSDEYLEVEIQKLDGEIYIYEIEKDYDEDLGIEFTNPIIDKAKVVEINVYFVYRSITKRNERDTLF